MLLPELLKRKRELEALCPKLEAWLQKAPKGKLWVSTSTQNGKTRVRYYTDERKYLSLEKDRHLLEVLSTREYYRKILKSARKELDSINALIRDSSLIPSVCSSTHQAKRFLFKPLEEPAEEKIGRFLAETYKKNDFAILNPKDTIKGDVVRSWPEALIANTLFEEKIPYRYERPFTLFNKHVIWPDFTILHPLTGDLFIWEHLGLTSKQSYKANMVSKIKDYAKSGIILGKNLILTFEDDEQKLTKEEVVQLIKVFFK